MAQSHLKEGKGEGEEYNERYKSPGVRKVKLLDTVASGLTVTGPGESEEQLCLLL